MHLPFSPVKGKKLIRSQENKLKEARRRDDAGIGPVEQPKASARMEAIAPAHDGEKGWPPRSKYTMTRGSRQDVTDRFISQKGRRGENASAPPLVQGFLC